MILRHKDEIESISRRFNVSRLELFGSAVTGDFEPGRSDLDFLVEFQSDAPEGYADRYFGLLEGLERLLGCPVELIVGSVVKNPYFRESIDRNKVLLYAA